MEEEEQILARGRYTQTDVLKVGHHGSRTATSSSLLSVVRPKISLISVGLNNSFHHPHAETISLLQKMLIPIYRTDLVGRVSISANGDNISSIFTATK